MLDVITQLALLIVKFAYILRTMLLQIVLIKALKKIIPPLKATFVVKKIVSV